MAVRCISSHSEELFRPWSAHFTLSMARLFVPLSFCLFLSDHKLPSDLANFHAFPFYFLSPLVLFIFSSHLFYLILLVFYCFVFPFIVASKMLWRSAHAAAAPCVNNCDLLTGIDVSGENYLSLNYTWSLSQFVRLALSRYTTLSLSMSLSPGVFFFISLTNPHVWGQRYRVFKRLYQR